MTAWLFRPLRALALAALFALALGGSTRADDPVKGEVRVETANGFTRLIFRFEKPVPATVKLSWPVMVIEFQQPVSVPVDDLKAAAPELISMVRSDPDGGALRIALSQKIKFNTITAAERFYVDLLPETWTGVLPGLPQEVIEELAQRARDAERQLKQQRKAEKQQKVPAIRVRVATQPTFTRYVFDLPDSASVVTAQGEDRFTLSFDQPIKWDLADALSALPQTLSGIEARNDGDSGTVSFILNGTPQVRSFREDRSIVVDVSHDGAKLSILSPPADKLAAAKQPVPPGIAAPATVPAKDAPASTKAAPPPAKLAANEPAPKAEPAKPEAAPKVEASKPEAAPNPAAVKPEVAPKLEAAKSEPPKTEPMRPELPKIEPAHPQPAKSAPAPKLAQDKPEVAPKPDLAPLMPVEKPAILQKATAPPAQAEAAPKADGTVVLRVQQSSDRLRLEFPFVAPTPAAVFMRADTLWLVFATGNRIDVSALAGHPNDTVRTAVVTRGAEGEAIVRLHLARPRVANLEADGAGWVVTIADGITAPTRPLQVARSIVGKDSAQVVIPFDRPGKLFHIADPDIGDRLLVVTALGPARGFVRAQNYVELHTLASTQGVAVHPIADDVAAELTDKAIILTRPGGLSLSTAAMLEPEPSLGVRSLTFDTQLWGFDRKADFEHRQSDLIRAAAEAPPSRQHRARLNLARFYLARGMSAEAKGVLDVARTDERGREDVTGSVLSAVANVMLDRPDEALKDLSRPTVGNQLDAPVWRAIAFVRQGKWVEARDGFKSVDQAIAGLPIELQRVAMLAALRAAIETGDYTQGARLSNEVDTVGLSPYDVAHFAVLNGRIDQGLGRVDDALASYRTAAASDDRRAAAQGRLHEIELRLALNEMPRGEAVAALETLTTIWRGDETEIEGLRVLAHLYTEDGRFRDAFHVMRTALLSHPNSDLTRKIQDEAALTFDSLFLTPKGDSLKPIEALALFYDYRQLTPIGRRGDEMIRRLADRLVGVDLLDQAAELLQHQVDKRLQGAARAQVAARLAAIYLMNHKPDQALAVLRATRSGQLAGELREQRLLIEARATSDIGRHDLALELIANIEGVQAQRLRADILWSARRWRAAAEQIELMMGDRWKKFEPLNENERFDVMRATIGYTLADETLALGRFRERYGPKMSDGPDAHAFEVVSAPIGAAAAEFKTVAKRLAATDTLDAFLADMRKRYPDAPLPAEATSEKAPTPPAPVPGKSAAAAPPQPPAAQADPRPTGSIVRPVR